MTVSDDTVRTLDFEFIEYATPEPAAFGVFLERLGFSPIARHRSKDVILYRQREINIVVNADVATFERAYTHLGGVRICAVALRVRDAAAAYEHALRRGAWEVESPVGVMELHIPAIAGIGETVTYFVDRFEHPSIYDIDFIPVAASPGPAAPEVGLRRIHSVTFAVRKGRARECADFCATVLGLAELDRRGDDASAAPFVTLQGSDGRVRFVFVESIAVDDPSRRDASESAQHIALETDALDATIAALNARGVAIERDAGARRAFTARDASPAWFELLEHRAG